MGGMIDATAVVLAGGKSSRFGSDKALASLGGESLLMRCVLGLLRQFPEVIVVSKRPDTYAFIRTLGRTSLACDRYAEHNPLAGLEAGLSAAATASCFVCACDMPLIQAPLLAALHGRLPGYDAVVPLKGQSPQPLCAFYRRSCLEGARRLLLEGKGPLDLLKTLNTRWVGEEESARTDPEGLSFIDVDTREDLLRTEKTLGRRRPAAC